MSICIFLIFSNIAYILFVPHQVRHARREEEAGHPARQRGSAAEAQRPDPAGRRDTECHCAVPHHRSAAKTGSTGLVSVPIGPERRTCCIHLMSVVVPPQFNYFLLLPLLIVDL